VRTGTQIQHRKTAFTGRTARNGTNVSIYFARLQISVKQTAVSQL
jgi:hypothetical protein